MPGFIHDALADVNLIADNLRDRYKDDFAIIKELVQNADDASASALDLGFSRGLKNAHHPLLRGPSLLVLNNGPFEPTDYDAIRRFGLNSKAADDASIGKFGLGMKSVFHLCEALFFMAETGNTLHAELLSPWGEALHDDWAVLTESDRDGLRSHVLSSLQWRPESLQEKPFILYLPLRRRDHLILPTGETAGAIIERFPGDDGLFLKELQDDHIAYRLASLLPLLRALRRIRVWLPSESSDGLECRHAIELMNNASRPDRQRWDGEAALRSEIALSISGVSAPVARFTGTQRHFWTQTLQDIRASEFWPASWVRTSLGREQRTPDKAQPHAAAVFGEQPGRSSLTIRWAVFLPIDDSEENIEIPEESGSGYTLTLHGHFFVDAGRNGLYGLDGDTALSGSDMADERAVRRSWNIQLATGATLDLLIPALDQFTRHLSLSDSRSTALASSITRSQLWTKWSAAIVAKHAWVRIVHTEGTSWQRIPRETKTYPLPQAPQSDPGRPWRIFPILDELCQGAVLLDPLAPHLIKRSEIGEWGENQVMALVESLDEKSIFSSVGDIDYVSDFLRGCCSRNITRPAVQNALCVLLRNAVAAHSLSGLRRVAARVRTIAGLIQSSRRLPITVRKDFAAELLIQQTTAALVWPRELDPEDHGGQAELSTEDGETLLRALASAMKITTSEDALDACRLATEDVLRLAGEKSRWALIDKVRDLPVLSAFNCRRGKRQSVTPADLLAASEQRTLFRSGQGTTEEQRGGLALQFQNALLDEDLFIINTQTADLALGQQAQDVSYCDERAVLHSLGHKPRRLADSALRRDLARRLRLPDGDAKAACGFRFLLHARAEHFGSHEHLWVERHGDSNVWRKLWSTVLTRSTGAWNLIERDLADEVPQGYWRSLDLREVLPDQVLQLIRERGTGSISDLELTDQEYNEVLGTELHDADLWRRLPFHETTDGSRVAALAGSAYLHYPDLTAPPELLVGLHVIRRSTDPRVAAYQDQRIQLLEYKVVVRLALQTPSPAKYWRLILDGLRSQRDSVEFTDSLNASPWLPLRNARAVRPNEIISLPGFEIELERLVEEAGAFGCPALLVDGVCQHPAFALLRDHLFATEQGAFDRLCELLRSLPCCAVGMLEIARDDLPEIAALLADTPAAGALRGWLILNALHERFGAGPSWMVFEKACRRGIESPHVTEILEALPERIPQQVALKAFNAYLKILASQNDASGTLRKLKLRAVDGRWRSARELCANAEGVSRAAVLSNDQFRILKQIVSTSHKPIPASSQITGTGKPTATVLQDYFSLWAGRGIETVIGAFVSLLGEDSLSYAAELLQPRSMDWLLERVPWTKTYPPLNGAATPIDGASLEQAVLASVFHIEVVTQDTCMVTSLCGETIEVKVDPNCGHLLVSTPSTRVGSGNRHHVSLRLRAMDPSSMRDQRLSELLRKTSELVLKHVYSQMQPDLAAVWQELEHTEQFDVEVASKLILDHLLFYLRQLRVCGCAILVEQLREVDDRRRLVAEFDGQPSERARRADYATSLEKLSQLIRSDQDVQAALIDAVRNRLTDSQYQPTSVPFELFQNADDAVAELDAIKGFPSGKKREARTGDLGSVRRFIVTCAQHGIVSFLHWGRPVNWTGPADFDGRERGFHRDLEKMLVLSSSDKQIPTGSGQPPNVTGKFGLGFKSVFLACDRPILVSGRLQVEIAAGVLPRPLTGLEAQPYRELIRAVSPETREIGTLISLRLQAGSSEVITEDFLSLAGYLCAFGRAISEIVFIDHESTQHAVAWSGSTVLDIHALERGILPASGIRDVEKLDVLLVRLESGSVLFGLGSAGFRPLPRGTPSVWVTAPTREDAHLGFAIHALFDVDPGRSNLAATDARNIEVARQIGRELGKVLHTLHAVSAADISRLRDGLGLTPNATPYDLWASFWELCSNALFSTDSRAGRIASALLQTSLGALVDKIHIVPNGLPGNLKALTIATQVQYKLAGALTCELVVLALSRWQEWQDRSLTSKVVTDSVAKGLGRLRGVRSDSTLPSLSFSTVVSWLASSQMVIRPADARHIGHVLKELPSEDDRSEETLRDLRNAREVLANSRFVSEANTPEFAADLIIGGLNDDESRRAAFAPPERKLSPEYGEAGIEFVKFCRKQMKARAADLAEWAIATESLEERRAALLYLNEGDARHEMAHHIREHGIEGTWLQDISDSTPLVAGLGSSDIDELRYRVLASTDALKRSAAAFQPIADRPAPDPGVVLKRIRDWWHSEGTERLREYTVRTYPDGRSPILGHPAQPGFDRSEWLTLLARGAFYSIGRATDDQHRGFLEQARRNNWWMIFSAEHPENRAHEWMGVLDEFFDARVDDQIWEHWMRSFPALYRLSRWLEDYAVLFLDLDRIRKPYDLDTVLKTRSDPDQQGGGLDIPPPALGMGACFVIRELLRLGHVTNTHTHEHAYTPTAAVRRLIQEIGLEIDDGANVRVSSQIFKHLRTHLGDGATFDGAYDIPLQLIARDENLQRRILSRSIATEV